MLSTLKTRTAEVLHSSQDKSRLARIVDYTLIALIALNVLAVVLESVPEIRESLLAVFVAFELFSVALFTVEYVMRVWSVTESSEDPRYRDRFRGRLRYMISPMALIDLLAILPFYLAFFVSVDLRFLRVLRLLRILKLTRYSSATNMLIDVFREEARVIGASMFVLLLLLVVASSCIYLVEHNVQPEGFGTIPRSMWWAIITMTTVGYGDVVPVTALGKTIGAFMGVIGIGMVALPAGILASGFNNALHSRRKVLRKEIHRVLEDGEIRPPEMEELELKRQELHLSGDDLLDLIVAISNHHEKQASRRHQCPHCGEHID